MKEIGWIAVILFLTWGGVRFANHQIMERGCMGHLERAAHTNDINTAKKELKIALDYLEKQNLTSGYTSLLWTTPDEDVGFWYENMTNALADIETVTDDATNMEKSNMLLKLRETLITHGEKGESIIAPDGISVFPYNKVFALWGLVSFVIGGLFLMFIGWIE